MNKIDINNPRSAYAIFVVVLVLAGLYFGWDYYYTPTQAQIQEMTDSLAEKQAELDKINIQKRRIALLEKDLDAAEKEFARLKEMFPEEEKVPLRLQDLYSVVRSAGVQIVRFNPETRTDKDLSEYYVQNRYSLAVNAGYHMLGYMFAEIANFSYPTSITDLKVTRYAGMDAEVEKAALHGWIPITTSVTFNLTTYTSRNLSK